VTNLSNDRARVVAARSPAAQKLWCEAERVARFSTSVLICGETGTGKSALARSIHAMSPRCKEPFVSVDCAGLPEGLLESELYGVARGGFTGASVSRAGRFEAARRGTLFLDEVGELSLAGQLKLLRALEENTFERIGETRPRQIEARVLAATHVDLAQAVAEGRFREDLYYRLHVLRLCVPPLREQSEDFEIWLEVSVAKAADRLSISAPALSNAARARLRAHVWPGNLRELFHCMEAAFVLCEGPTVEAELIDRLLDPDARGRAPKNSFVSSVKTGRAGQERVAAPCGNSEARASIAGNVSRAARELGVPRSTLRYRLGLDDALARTRRNRAARSRSDESPPQ